MAIATVRAKAATVNVVLCVTADTTGRRVQGGGCLTLMTKRAGQTGVRTFERIVGLLRMIESPADPGGRVMTLIARFAQRAVVCIIAKVTALTVARQFSETR